MFGLQKCGKLGRRRDLRDVCKNGRGSKKHQILSNSYCERESFKLAQRIDDKMAIVIKPKPKYCPLWLYKKIIKDCVEFVQVR